MLNIWLYLLIGLWIYGQQSDATNSSFNVEHLTDLLGHPIGRKTSLLTAGLNGPALLQDVQFLDEMASFDRERIPERVAHAKGSAAFGTFRVTNSYMKKYTKMSLLSKFGQQTKVAVRFSTVSGEKGSADTVFGDPRGFAVKFYTSEGIWDLVGLNAPMFFIRNAMQFPSLIHVHKRNPMTGLKDPTAFWDFQSLRPETLNLVTHVFSPMGLPQDFRHMPGFSVHAYKLVNIDNKHVYAKFHWIPNQGIKYMDTKKAAKLSGIDPDYHRRDLFEAIASRRYPSWTLKMQVITNEQVKKFDFNPFDATKIWPEKKYPLIPIGVMTLDRNPTNFFAEVEQLAFCPANMVPGIEPSPDLLLAGRLFAYSDTQRYRMGANFYLLAVNSAPSVSPTERDGRMGANGNMGSYPNYYPNSFSAGRDNPKYLSSNYTIGGQPNPAHNLVYRYDDNDDHNYEQPRDLYHNFTDGWKDQLHRNLAFSMRTVKPFIRERTLEEFKKIDPKYSVGVRTQLNKLLHKV